MRLVKHIKNRILFYTVIFSGAFFFLKILLNIYNLEYRNKIYFVFLLIVTVGVIVGVIQLVRKIKSEKKKNIVTSVVYTLCIFLALFSLLIFAGLAMPEHIIYEDGNKFVGYSDGLIDRHLYDYYKCENFFIRSKLPSYRGYSNGNRWTP